MRVADDGMSGGLGRGVERTVVAGDELLDLLLLGLGLSVNHCGGVGFG